MKNITKIAISALFVLPTTLLAWGNYNEYYGHSNAWRPHTCACQRDFRNCPDSYRLICTGCGECYREYRHFGGYCYNQRCGGYHYWYHHSGCGSCAERIYYSY